jgi:cobalt-zinc-cadmium resistance protein CzcA
MVSQNNGSPIRIKDVAQVEIGYQPRLGIAGQDKDDDIVQGIVLMRRGEQSLPTFTELKRRLTRSTRRGFFRPGYIWKRSIIAAN